MSKVKPSITLNLHRVEGEGRRPLHIKFDIHLSADDPRQDTIYDSLGKFLTEILPPGDAEELLLQWEEQQHGFTGSQPCPR